MFKIGGRIYVCQKYEPVAILISLQSKFCRCRGTEKFGKKNAKFGRQIVTLYINDVN